MESQQFPLPKTFLSGFLSTGKTILHNYILHRNHFLKNAALTTSWRSNRISHSYTELSRRYSRWREKTDLLMPPTTTTRQ